MGMAITHFMWGYQPHFRIGQEVVAKRSFQILDDNFDPEIFLVGILTEEKDDRFLSCVEPEEDFWIKSEDLNKVAEIAKSIIKTYPEKNIIQSLPLAQERQFASLSKKSIQDGIKSIIDNHKFKPQGMSYWVSFPSKVDCYLVSVVIGLQDCVIDSFYRLKKNKVRMHEYRNIEVPTSLIDATISEFLNHATEELTKPDPGLNDKKIDSEDFIRYAGDRLMRGIVCRIDQNCIEGMHHLFRACCTVSSLYYERSIGSGTIILAEKDHSAIQKTVLFENHYNLREYRGARKLLELGRSNMGLHCDSEKIYGLASIDKYDPANEDLFEVKILDHHHWELVHNNQTLMRVHYGQPYLPKISFEIEKLRIDLPRIFKGIGVNEINQLIQIVSEAAKERHGTMLLISEAAQGESRRLKTQGIPLVPCQLNSQLLRSLTPIDGAVLLSPDSKCYSIGTILDGKASDTGDSSRGARYNSALKYIQSSQVPCIAIVVSEDGGIDLIPNLRPPIKRSDIEVNIAELRNLCEIDTISWRIYSKLLDWFDDHRFYLLESHCNLVNKLKQKIDKRLDSEQPRNLKIIRSEYAPHKEMDTEIYYIKEKDS